MQLIFLIGEEAPKLIEDLDKTIDEIHSFENMEGLFESKYHSFSCFSVTTGELFCLEIKTARQLMAQFEEKRLQEIDFSISNITLFSHFINKKGCGKRIFIRLRK